jgi:hypothetical protein
MTCKFGSAVRPRIGGEMFRYGIEQWVGDPNRKGML